MDTPKSILRILGSALLIAVLLSTSAGQPLQVNAQAGVTWDIHSEQTSNSTTTSNGTSEDLNIHSDQHSSDGQNLTDDQSRHLNEDGSYEEHDDFTHTDPTGKSDYDKGRSHTDTAKDKDGNRKVHHEEIIRKNGKCQKFIRDEVYDKNNNLIDHHESTQDVSCNLYSLEVRWEGELSGEHQKIKWGPDTTEVALVGTDKTYTGNNQGIWKATATGNCNGSGTFPVSIEVTANQDEFEDLDFSVKLIEGSYVIVNCPEGTGQASLPPTTNTYTFTLHAEDGATTTIAKKGAVTRLTFTLKKEKF